jgi:hypothetical protein
MSSKWKAGGEGEKELELEEVGEGDTDEGLCMRTRILPFADGSASKVISRPRRPRESASTNSSFRGEKRGTRWSMSRSIVPGERQSESRGRNERKSILEATAELTLAAVFDRGNEPDMGTADWEVVETENMEGSAQSRTCGVNNKRSVDMQFRFQERRDSQGG